MINSLNFSYTGKQNAMDFPKRAATANQKIPSFSSAFDDNYDTFLPNKNDLIDSSLESSIIISEKVKDFFGWSDVNVAMNHLKDEVRELEEGLENQDYENIKEEVGDVISIASEIAHMNGISPETAMQERNEKFINRFQKMQEIAEKPLPEYSKAENRILWNQAKMAIKAETKGRRFDAQA